MDKREEIILKSWEGENKTERKEDGEENQKRRHTTGLKKRGFKSSKCDVMCCLQTRI